MITWKTLRTSGVRRRDVHRPLAAYRFAFAATGLRIVAAEATPSIDPDTLDASSDYLLLELAPTEDRSSR